jgi:hypothetical protein
LPPHWRPFSNSFSLYHKELRDETDCFTAKNIPTNKFNSLFSISYNIKQLPDIPAGGQGGIHPDKFRICGKSTPNRKNRAENGKKNPPVITIEGFFLPAMRVGQDYIYELFRNNLPILPRK